MILFLLDIDMAAKIWFNEPEHFHKNTLHMFEPVNFFNIFWQVTCAWWPFQFEEIFNQEEQSNGSRIASKGCKFVISPTNFVKALDAPVVNVHEPCERWQQTRKTGKFAGLKSIFGFVHSEIYRGQFTSKILAWKESCKKHLQLLSHFPYAKISSRNITETLRWICS
jgi:hypothetical protein